MNKEYIYIDGKVIIKDEKGNHTPVEYYDNLDEVLIQENVIETIEKRISTLENKSNEYKETKYFPYSIIAEPLLTLIGVPVLISLSGLNVFTTTAYTSFGTMNLAVVIGTISCIIGIPVAVCYELGMYSQHKTRLKKAKGIDSELEFLKVQLKHEKEKLIELTEAKKRNNENKEFRVVEVNDLERLNKLASWLDLYYDLGYDLEKYYKYYQKGKLDSKLGKRYNENGIEAAKEYLEEKSKTLIKKKTKSKTKRY